MRAHSKAVLKTKLHVEQSSRTQEVPDAVIIDGCAMLWTGHLSISGTFEDYVFNFMGTITYHLEGNSTKQIARYSRSDNDASREHQFSIPTALPTHNEALNVLSTTMYNL